MAARLKTLAHQQLGTIGAGNHYVDVFTDEQDRVWVGVHFGSRGLGHKLATHFLRAGGARDGMAVPPLVLKRGHALFDDYVAAMRLAGDYAHAGRDWVCAEVVRLLGPAMFAASYALTGSYGIAFGLVGVPAMLAIYCLTAVQREPA